MQLLEILYLLALNIAAFYFVIKKEWAKGVLLSSCHAVCVHIFIAINQKFCGKPCHVSEIFCLTASPNNCSMHVFTRRRFLLNEVHTSVSETLWCMSLKFRCLKDIFPVHAKLLQINISLEPLNFYLCFHSAQENKGGLIHRILPTFSLHN